MTTFTTEQEAEFDAAHVDFSSIKLRYPGLYKRALQLFHNRGVTHLGLTYILTGELLKKMERLSLDQRDFPSFMHSIFEPLISYAELLLQYPVGIERAKATHRLVDKAIKDKPLLKAQTKCKKNCSACCHGRPYVSESEVDLILDYTLKNDISIDRDRLKTQMQYSDNFDHVKKLSWEQSACVFLGDDGSCKIYPVRPSTCRKHFAVSEPRLCDVRISDYSALAVYEKAEIITSAALNLETPAARESSYSLPELLLLKLEENTQ